MKQNKYIFEDRLMSRESNKSENNLSLIKRAFTNFIIKEFDKLTEIEKIFIEASSVITERMKGKK